MVPITPAYGQQHEIEGSLVVQLLRQLVTAADLYLVTSVHEELLACLSTRVLQINK
jgi:hypothetical protein